VRRALALAGILSALAVPARAGVDRYDRAQMYHYAQAGTPYLPLATTGAASSDAAITINPIVKINLDGDPRSNVLSNVLAIDVDRDGVLEFVQYDGSKLMKLWSRNGTKRWQVTNPAGFSHRIEDPVYRDTAAILDLNGDGKQDIAHCWVANGKRTLVLRRGFDGAVIKQVALLPTNFDTDCLVVAVRFAARAQPLLLVPSRVTDGSCPRNWIGYWAKTMAFDLAGNKVWERNTCDAGHYVYPLDENQDGKAEATFVGRYLLRADGSVQCTLQGWYPKDHADAVIPGDVDPAKPGFEAVAVGVTGTAMFTARTCRRIWRLPYATIANPQRAALARLDPKVATLQIVVEDHGNGAGSQTVLLDKAGKVVVTRQTTGKTMPIQNANIDGKPGSDELIGSFGEVFGRNLVKRANRGWFWHLKGTTVREDAAMPLYSSYGRWQAFPLVIDLDRDGRDEIVQWSQTLLVIGKAR
jgi:hypothetical protein